MQCSLSRNCLIPEIFHQSGVGRAAVVNNWRSWNEKKERQRCVMNEGGAEACLLEKLGRGRCNNPEETKSQTGADTPVISTSFRSVSTLRYSQSHSTPEAVGSDKWSYKTTNRSSLSNFNFGYTLQFYNKLQNKENIKKKVAINQHFQVGKSI